MTKAARGCSIEKTLIIRVCIHAIAYFLVGGAIATGRARNKYYGSLGWLGKRKQWSHCALATVFDHAAGRSSVKYATRTMKYAGKSLNIKILHLEVRNMGY